MTTLKGWTDSMKEFDKTAVTRTLGTFAKLISIKCRICGSFFYAIEREKMFRSQVSSYNGSGTSFAFFIRP